MHLELLYFVYHEALSFNLYKCVNPWETLIKLNLTETLITAFSRKKSYLPPLYFYPHIENKIKQEHQV